MLKLNARLRTSRKPPAGQIQHPGAAIDDHNLRVRMAFDQPRQKPPIAFAED
ncbi:MAG TPA: hypothetical protein VMH80_18745 [Bryobacteraceae bacterium]|nr:hypothetical protein [Bryobacteraceae bacterium]